MYIDKEEIIIKPTQTLNLPEIYYQSPPPSVGGASIQGSLTSIEFGKVFGLPVLPIPGLSTCTNAYKEHGDEISHRRELLPDEL